MVLAAQATFYAKQATTPGFSGRKSWGESQAEIKGRFVTGVNRMQEEADCNQATVAPGQFPAEASARVLLRGAYTYTPGFCAAQGQGVPPRHACSPFPAAAPAALTITTHQLASNSPLARA